MLRIKFIKYKIKKKNFSVHNWEKTVSQDNKFTEAE